MDQNCNMLIKWDKETLKTHDGTVVKLSRKYYLYIAQIVHCFWEMKTISNTHVKKLGKLKNHI